MLVPLRHMAVNSSSPIRRLATPEPSYPGSAALDRFETASLVLIKGRGLLERTDVKFYGRVAALGFLASQQQFLDEVFDARAVAEEYQVSIAKVEKLTHLDFGPLKDLDAGQVAAFPIGQEQRRLTGESQIFIPR